VTHDVREALRLGTRIALLARGRLEVLTDTEDFRRTRTAEAQALLACVDD